MESQEWWIDTVNGVIGPFSPEQLHGFASEGRIDRETLINLNGVKWVRAKQVRRLFDHIDEASIPDFVDIESVKPLDDPMRLLSKYMKWITLAVLAWAPLSLALMGLGAAIDSITTVSAAASGFALTVVGLPYCLSLWRILPRRDVDIIYLRSFRRDKETARIRLEIHKATGGKMRLSGIRDPRRRWPKFLRFAFFFLFALRHLSPRYLNLEA